MDVPDNAAPTLVVRGRWSQKWPAARVVRSRLLPIAGASAAVHLVLIGTLLLVQALRWVPLTGPPPLPAVVELVLNDPGHGGAPRDRGQGRQPHAPQRPAVPAAPAAAAPPPVPRPPSPQAPTAATPEVPQAPTASLPPPLPRAPPPPETRTADIPPPPAPDMKTTPDATTTATAEATPSPPADAPPPAVRLGDDGDGGETDEVLGARTAPPAPDGSVRNIPPRYPRAAVLRNEEGQVVLLLHVGIAGEVTDVEIARSSGSLALDSAAQTAALAWHFKPALRDGLPVESTLPYGISFQLNGASGNPRGDTRR